MLGQMLLWVLDTVCGFFSTALVARFALQFARVSFRNPLGQFVIAVTDWMVIPARRFIPGLYGMDLSSVFLAWLWQLAYLGIALGLSGILIAVSPAPIFFAALVAALEVVKIGLYVTVGVVLISAVFSWINPHAPMADTFNALSRPLLRPWQRWIPPVGGVDLSPMALIVVLQIALFFIAHLRATLFPYLSS